MILRRLQGKHIGRDIWLLGLLGHLVRPQSQIGVRNCEIGTNFLILNNFGGCWARLEQRQRLAQLARDIAPDRLANFPEELENVVLRARVLDLAFGVLVQLPVLELLNGLVDRLNPTALDTGPRERRAHISRLNALARCPVALPTLVGEEPKLLSKGWVEVCPHFGVGNSKPQINMLCQNWSENNFSR